MMENVGTYEYPERGRWVRRPIHDPYGSKLLTYMSKDHRWARYAEIANRDTGQNVEYVYESDREDSAVMLVHDSRQGLNLGPWWAIFERLRKRGEVTEHFENKLFEV